MSVHEISLEEINPTDPTFWTRPLEERQAAFATLRRERPIAFFEEPAIDGTPVGPGYYALTRYDDVVEVSRNPEIYCSGLGSTSVTDMPPEAAEFFGSFITMDDPRHARLRGIVSRRFTPKQLSKVMDDVTHIADEVIDDMCEKGETDFVADIAAPFPLLIICDMMGIPRSEYRTVLDSARSGRTTSTASPQARSRRSCATPPPSSTCAGRSPATRCCPATSSGPARRS